MSRAFRICVGGVLVVLGVAGLVLPILQGLLFLALGGVLLSRDVPLFGRGVGWFKACFPGISTATERIKNSARERRRK